MRLPKGLSIVPFNNITVARLYDTNIVTIDYNKNLITFNSGGWKTKHTKKCTNLALKQFNISVHQQDFEWYVTTNKGVYKYVDGLAVSF